MLFLSIFNGIVIKVCSIAKQRYSMDASPRKKYKLQIILISNNKLKC